MSILKYFKLVKSVDAQLPGPKGTLNGKIGMCSLAIASANSAVHSVITINSTREPYLHLTPAQKFQIGKRASKHGVTSV